MSTSFPQTLRKGRKEKSDSLRPSSSTSKEPDGHKPSEASQPQALHGYKLGEATGAPRAEDASLRPREQPYLVDGPAKQRAKSLRDNQEELGASSQGKITNSWPTPAGRSRWVSYSGAGRRSEDRGRGNKGDVPKDPGAKSKSALGKFLDRMNSPEAYPSTYQGSNASYGRRGEFEWDDNSMDGPQAQAENWKTKYLRLKDDTQAYDEVIETLQKQVREKVDELEDAKRSAGQMQIELENKEFSLGTQATDAEVQSKFESILNRIRTWAIYFDEKGRAEFEEDLRQEYLRVIPNQPLDTLPSLLREKKRVRLFIRGCAASVMCARLIRTLPRLPHYPGSESVDHWLDEKSSTSFSHLESKLCLTDRTAISERAFNDWRALTADLLARSSQNSDESAHAAARNKAVEEVMALVEPWTPRAREAELGNLLGSIFDDAVRFSRTLRTQRACWYVRWPSRQRVPGPAVEFARYYSLMFEPTEMKNEPGDDEDADLNVLRNQLVEMVITPSLFKSGTSKGDRFDEEFCAVQAKVLIREWAGK